MTPRSSSPICERSLDLTLIGIGRRDIPQCSSKHFHMEAFYRTFSGGQRPRSWRGDQRSLVARATKSSSSAGTARKPICSSWAERLWLGIVVVWIGEFIVGLQIVGANVKCLRFRMPAEIDCRQPHGALVSPQQEGDC